MSVRKGTAESLAALVAQASARAGVVGHFLHLRGDAYTELVRTAEDLRVDAVVVGASTQFGHRIAGSLAGRLVRHAKWPIVVVP
jgi:nucleotide-binding universal stress UspA family protein